MNVILSARRCCTLFEIILLFLSFSSQPVRANGQPLTIYSVTQQDLDGDGRPDLTIIDCAFVTDHDRIYVYDQGGDMRPSSDWREATDFDDDVWLYDIGAKGSAQLAVVYRVEDGHDTAYIYDDQDGDGKVSYQLTGKQVTITESPYWTVRISSGSQWFSPDGHLNLNIRMELDGPVWTFDQPGRDFSYPQTFDRMPAYFVRDYMKHDGQVDAEFEQVADSNGIAKYALKRLLTPSPADWAFERTRFMSNEGHYPTRPRPDSFFPFLPIPISTNDPRVLQFRYFDLPPDVGVDWSHSKVLGIWMDGYPIGAGYHFNDDYSLKKGQVNDVDFESPQAYYDLANNHDAFPELHIWFFTHPSDDPGIWSPPDKGSIPWQGISYSWNLFNPGTLRWDFKVGLAGTYPITSVVNFADFAVRTVPYKELPHWITEREWLLRTFVAREGDGYESSEGIYDWQSVQGENVVSPDNPSQQALEAALRYMFGLSPIAPDAYFQNIQKGFRAERDFAGPAKARLYFSPIDHKLHLARANYGIWNIDEQHLIRYANLDGDAYLDQWQYVENGTLRRQLNATGSYLVYAGENEVVLKKISVAPSLFEMLPPSTHEEWLTLGQRLKANQPDFAPGDFRAMLAQFNVPEWRIEGATLRGFRPVNGGFRFVLELQPNFSIHGSGGPDLIGKQPGAYVVSYHGKFKVEPLSPPVLSASLVDAAFTQLEPGALQVALRNDGLEDLPQATLELWATPPQGPAQRVVTQTVTLLAQAPITTTLQWVPPFAGKWILTAQIRQPDDRVITFAPADVTVLPAPMAAPAVMIAVSTSSTLVPLIILGLIAFATLAAWIFWSQWRRSRVEPSDDRT